MPDSQPSNAVLAAKLDSLRELMEVKFQQTDRHFIENDKNHEATKNHLGRLNGQVAKNSTFRIRAITFYSIVAFIVPIAVTLFINKYL